MNIIKKFFSWNISDFIKCVIGIFIFSLGINLFVTPNHLYNGGILGLSQLIRTILVNNFAINVSFDISAIIYYFINIPLFIIAYKKISKTFFARTLLCVTLNSLFLIIIPTVSKPFVDDILTSVLIGGVVCGFGAGLCLSSGSSTGGTDIIGIVLSKKNRMFSVGNVGLIFNVFIYAICGLLNGIQIMIYSILYSVFDTLAIDKTHDQNISSEAFIFTKNNPNKMIKFINNDLDRDATYWEAVGGYSKTKTFITYTVLSRYERARLERHMKEFNDDAFMVSDEGVIIRGKFDKKL